MPKIEQLEDGKKVKIQLDGGEVFEGDWLTATQKLAESKEETAKWARGIKAENDTLKAQPRPEPVKPAVNAEEEQLRTYLAEQQAKYFGFNSAQEMKQKLETISAVTDDTANKAVAMEFMNQCPDFPNTQESIDKLAKKMDDMGYDYTPQSMIAAHMLCLRDNAYQPLTNEEVKQTVSRTQPPPPVVRSGSPEVSQTQNANDPWSLPLDQLKSQYMKRYFEEQSRQ